MSLLLSLVLSCAGPGGAEQHWSVEIALRAPDKLGGCAVGDLDRSRPGAEIAAVCRNGDVFVVHRGERGFAPRIAFRAPGEMIQCAIGDADPRSPGLELVAVGMAGGPEEAGGPGACWLVRHDGTGWEGEPLPGSSALVHGVAVGDGEVFTTGFDARLHRLVRRDDGWHDETIAELPGAGKSLALTEDGVVAACTDGSLVEAVRAGAGWTTRVLDERGAGRARVTSRDGLLVSADDDGALSLLDGEGRHLLHREPDKLRGAVLAELDAGAPGLEAATGGYGGAVTVLYRAERGAMGHDRGHRGSHGDDGTGDDHGGGGDDHGGGGDGGAWHPVSLFRDTDRLHHLAAGDLDGDGVEELVACGYSGLLVVVRRTDG